MLACAQISIFTGVNAPRPVCVRLSAHMGSTNTHKHFIAQLGARNSLFRTRKFYSLVANVAGGDVRGRNKQDIFNAQVTTYFYGPGRS